MSKRQAIVLAVTRLAAAIKASYEEGQLDIYADALEDVRPRVLELAFTHLEKHHAIPALPAPGEIREIGLVLRGEERRREDEAEYNQRMDRWKAEAQTNPITEDERAELKDKIHAVEKRMDMTRDYAANQRQAELLRRARVNNLLQGVEFYLELKRVKRDRERLAKALEIAG